MCWECCKKLRATIRPGLLQQDEERRRRWRERARSEGQGQGQQVQGRRQRCGRRPRAGGRARHRSGGRRNFRPGLVRGGGIGRAGGLDLRGRRQWRRGYGVARDFALQRGEARYATADMPNGDRRVRRERQPARGHGHGRWTLGAGSSSLAATRRRSTNCSHRPARSLLAATTSS